MRRGRGGRGESRVGDVDAEGLALRKGEVAGVGLPLRKGARARPESGAYTRPIFQLNVSAFCEIRWWVSLCQ